MYRQITAAAAASLLLFALSGCGGSDSDGSDNERSAEETAAIASLTDKISSGDQASSMEFFGPDFPACFAETLVDGAGVEQLQKDKVLTEDNKASEDFDTIDSVSDESATAFADAEYDCIDWDQVSTYLKENNDSKIDESKIDEYVSCMSDIDEDDWKAASKDQAMGTEKSDAISTFQEATTACQAKI